MRKSPIIIILGVLFVSGIALASEERGAAYDNIHELYRYYHEKAPNSCEAIYYGLFTNGTEKIPYFETPQGKSWPSDQWGQAFANFQKIHRENLEDAISERKNRLHQNFGKAKELFSNTILAQNSFQSDPVIIEEWKSRLQKTKLAILDEKINSTGAFMDVYNKGYLVDPSGAAYKHSEIKVLKNDEDNVYTEIAPRWTGLEEIKQPIMRYLDGMGPPVVGWSHDIFYGISSDAANIFMMGHELSHLIDWAPVALKEVLAHRRSYQARESLKSIFRFSLSESSFRETFRKIKFREDLDKNKNETGHGEMGFGRGTGDYEKLKDLLNQGNLKEAKEILKARLDSQPEQMSEAVADAFATMIVAEFIDTNYTTAREKKEAALSVLFKWSPHLFSKEAREIMDASGSKKSNETRVFRIILADRKFRDFIGCNFFSGSAPLDFSQVNQSPHLGDPNGDGRIDELDSNIMYDFHWRYADLLADEEATLDLDQDGDIDIDDAKLLVNWESKNKEPTPISPVTFTDIETYKRQAIETYGSMSNALYSMVSEAEDYYREHKQEIDNREKDHLMRFEYLVFNARNAFEGAKHRIYQSVEGIPSEDVAYYTIHYISNEEYENRITRLRALEEKLGKIQ